MPAKIRSQTFKNGAAISIARRQPLIRDTQKSKNVGWNSSEYRAPCTDNYLWAITVPGRLSGAENVVNGNTVPRLC